mmetsp:Transcript_25210/g.59481  ORF Transcript_25210/g.59481 Transcript_25210/m.59481 type:complete len:115 (+) Transcript_25210:93-437(+)
MTRPQEHLLWIAERALNAPLPSHWTEHLDGQGRIFFMNHRTNSSSWDHPLDKGFHKCVAEVRQQVAVQSALEQVMTSLRTVHAQSSRRIQSSLQECVTDTVLLMTPQEPGIPQH